MKNLLYTFIGISTLFIFYSCSKDTTVENDQTITSVSILASQTNILVGQTVTFNVVSDSGLNLNSDSTFSLNNLPISGNSYTFSEVGTFTFKATYKSLNSNDIVVTVAQNNTSYQFVNRVLVEEYSGTWCGNCPAILYGTELLKQQTDKSVNVQIHLLNGDPFITSDGNSLASSQNVNGVPTGKINRTTNWSGPQYQNVSQVINTIKASSTVGLAINSSLNSNLLNVNVRIGFTENVSTKLVVYLVEDNLFYTQANYSSNLYGGSSSISNFEYDGVLRSVISANSGDALAVTNNSAEKNYSISIPANINNSSNLKVVAFLIDSNSGAVLNARESTIGVTQELETL